MRSGEGVTVPYSLGVDLGTTFVAAAVAQGPRVEMFTLGDRTVVTPAVVYARDDGSVITGEAANRRAVSNPDRVGREFKRRLGDPTPVMLGGAPHAVTTLLAALLSDTVSRVTATEGAPPDHVVLTHPANWGPYRRELFDEVPHLAGVTEATMLTEPEAAAAHYAAARHLSDGDTVAVYDLGGGTFDATVLRRRAVGIDILGSPEGIERLGGVDFDDAVLAYINYTSGGALSELDLSNPQTAVALARLRQDAILAKEALSVDTEATIPVFLPHRHFDVHLARADFEDMIRAQVESTIGALSRTLRSAGVAPDELDAVLLVGGSSRIPLVGRMITEALERPTLIDAHPKYAVALGAAALAAELAPVPAGGSPGNGSAGRGSNGSAGNGSTRNGSAGAPHGNGVALGTRAAAGALTADRGWGGGPREAAALFTAPPAPPEIGAIPGPRDPSRDETDREPADPADPTASAHPTHAPDTTGAVDETYPADTTHPPDTAFPPDTTHPEDTSHPEDATHLVDTTAAAGTTYLPDRAYTDALPTLPKETPPNGTPAIWSPGATAPEDAAYARHDPTDRADGPYLPYGPHDDTPDPPTAHAPAGADPRRPRRGLVIAAAVAVLVLLGGAIGWGFTRATATPAAAPTPQSSPVLLPPPAQAPAEQPPTIAASVPIPPIGGEIPVGQTPGFVAIAPNGKFAYVANRAAGVVTVVDTTVDKVVASIPIPDGPPQYLAFAPDGSRLYVSVFNDQDRSINSVAVLDTRSNTVLTTIKVGTRPFALAVKPDGSELYVPNHDSGTVSVIDTRSDTLVTDIRVKPNPHWVAFSRDGRRAYTANHESNLVSVIDTATRSVVAEIPVQRSPHSVAVAPTRPLLANVNYDSNSLTVTDTDTEKVVATVPVGDHPQDVVWAPDGRHLYVTNVDGDSMTVVAVDGYRVTATVPTGQAPTSIAVLPDGRQAYISNLDSGTLTVVDLAG